MSCVPATGGRDQAAYLAWPGQGLKKAPEAPLTKMAAVGEAASPGIGRHCR